MGSGSLELIILSSNPGRSSEIIFKGNVLLRDATIIRFRIHYLWVSIHLIVSHTKSLSKGITRKIDFIRNSARVALIHVSNLILFDVIL